MERIFIKFGVEVLQDNDNYYTRFDAGELVGNVTLNKDYKKRS